VQRATGGVVVAFVGTPEPAVVVVLALAVDILLAIVADVMLEVGIVAVVVSGPLFPAGRVQMRFKSPVPFWVYTAGQRVRQAPSNRYCWRPHIRQPWRSPSQTAQLCWPGTQLIGRVLLLLCTSIVVKGATVTVGSLRRTQVRPISLLPPTMKPAGHSSRHCPLCRVRNSPQSSHNAAPLSQTRQLGSSAHITVAAGSDEA